MKRQRIERNIPEYPLFHHREIDELSYFQGLKYGRAEPWSPARTGAAGEPAPTVSFHPAGHVLGSAGLRVAHGRESLFYTGDVCFHNQTLSPKADFTDTHSDVLILETTRGATERPPGLRGKPSCNGSSPPSAKAWNRAGCWCRCLPWAGRRKCWPLLLWRWRLGN